MRSCCRTHLTLFISWVRRSAHPCILKAAVSFKTNQLLCTGMTFIFIGQFVGKKLFGERKVKFLGLLSKWFSNRKNIGYSKVTALVLIFHFRGYLLSFLGK